MFCKSVVIHTLIEIHVSIAVNDERKMDTLADHQSTGSILNFDCNIYMIYDMAIFKTSTN
jgi:hypothetical protein